ncbi:MAG: hypothetical protein ACOX7F_06215 [Eubacteriales bacterium]|jgi:hypothetical protein
MIKKITCVEDLEGILRQQFLRGFYDASLPLEIQDAEGRPICTIRKDDPDRWQKTPYEYSYAASKKLCSQQRWDSMHITQQIELCDCWYALAVSEYLEPAVEAGREFDLAD